MALGQLIADIQYSMLYSRGTLLSNWRRFASGSPDPLKCETVEVTILGQWADHERTETLNTPRSQYNFIHVK